MSTLALALATLASTQPASASRTADLEISMSLPVFDVDQSDTVTVTVDNVGTAHAGNVSIAIALPETATSPTTHVMGVVSNVDSSCWEDGTLIKCIMGSVSAGGSTSVSFDIALPQSSEDIEFYASTGSSSVETVLANNAVTEVADVLYPDLVLSGPVDMINQHCTGRDLSAFFECSLYPSSIGSHGITLEAGGTIAIGSTPYTGSWSQPTDDSLWFEYVLFGRQRLEFHGNAVDGSCFEGLSTFPGSPYVAPYRVCIR